MGWRGLSLLKKNGNVVPAETWVEIYRGGGRNRANASDKEARDNYSRLSRMLEIRDGDRLIIPNLTKEGRAGLVLTTAKRHPDRRPGQVGECYGFSSSVPRAFGGDRRHYVNVDPVRSEFFFYNDAPSAGAIPMAIQRAGLWKRVESADHVKNREIIRLLNRIAAEALDATPRRTIKNARIGVPPSAEQRERGKKGEEEILHRFKKQG